MAMRQSTAKRGTVGRWQIYVLKDPRTKTVRYVGWSVDARKRYRGHLLAASSKSPRYRVHQWIRELISIGLLPIRRVVEFGKGSGWSDAERRWISFYRAKVADLLNATSGGQGTRGFHLSAETKAKLSAKLKGRKAHNFKHGSFKNCLYRAWYNVRHSSTGFPVCRRWRNSFKNFCDDVGPRPSVSHVLGRVNKLLGYTPSNYRWMTRLRHAQTRSDTVTMTCDGTTRTLSEWSRITKIPYTTLLARRRAGWNHRDALTRPVAPKSGRPRKCTSS